MHQRAALHLHLDGLLAKLATKAMPTQMIKTDRVTVEHSSSVDAVGGGLAVDKRRAHITLKQNAAQDRAYIESCFGRSLYPPERLRKAEQELCVGDHLGCHLWFSAGVPSPEQAPTRRQTIWLNRLSCRPTATALITPKSRELHRSVVLRLTEQIRNCILVHQQPNARVARSGNLNAGRIWRAPLLNDDRVFFVCRGREPALFYGRPFIGRIRFPPALSGSDRGSRIHFGPEPCGLRYPGAGVQLQQPAGLHRTACAQRLCRQKPAKHQPVFCFRLEP